MQVEPTQSNLKAPGPKRVKLKYDNLLSSFAFKFNLRRNNKEELAASYHLVLMDLEMPEMDGATVSRCRLKPAETRVESALVSYMGEAPYGPLFPHSDKWGRPLMHH